MKNATLSDLFKNMLRGQPFSQKPCLGFFLPLIFVIGCSSNENKSTTRLEDVAGTSETDAHPIVLVLLSESAKSSGDSESTTMRSSPVSWNKDSPLAQDHGRSSTPASPDGGTINNCCFSSRRAWPMNPISSSSPSFSSTSLFYFLQSQKLTFY